MMSAGLADMPVSTGLKLHISPLDAESRGSESKDEVLPLIRARCSGRKCGVKDEHDSRPISVR